MMLHVLNSARAEGTVKLALDWLGEPAGRQEVLVLNPAPRDLTPRLQVAAGWYGEGRALPAGPAKALAIGWLVWRTCWRRQPETIICWVNGFAPWVLLGARLAGVRRLVTHAGNPPTATPAGRRQTRLSGFVAWLTGARMVCCSHYVSACYARELGAFASVLRTVYNCAPVGSIAEAAREARRRRTDRRPRLIMVATLEAHKDHATLLRAMPAVKKAVPDVVLLLAGAGSLRESLEKSVQQLALGETVQLLGSRRDVPALLGQSDVFVFSTTGEEGLGTVLIEALAAGLPVVASDVPACQELLESGRWGKLVPAGDPDALAAALIAALGAKTGEPGTEELRDYLARFTPKNMMAAYAAALG